MQILTIDDRPELAEIGGYFDQENKQVILTKDKEGSPRLLYDVACQVKQEAPDLESGEKCIIFLNLFLECQDDDFNWQQDQAGIALLKFLRMIGVNHHVVLLSPFSLEHLIQQDAANYIIASKGVSLIEPKFDSLYNFSEFEGYYDIQTHKQEEEDDTENSVSFANQFAQYLYEWMTKYGWIQEKKQSRTKKDVEKETVALHELADNTFDANNLIDYLKSGFELPADERHNWANWWGIIQLCDVHRSAFPDELNFGNDKSYPGSIDDSLKSLRNFQLRKIYQADENFQDVLVSRLREDLQEDLILYGYEIDDLEENIQQLKTNIDAAESSKIKNNLGQELKNLKSKKNEWIKERKKSEIKLTELNRVIEPDDQNVTEDYINEFRFVESEHKPQILYIDDQAHEGWSDIFQIMIYGEKNQPEHVFKSIQHIDDDIDSFYKNTIKHEIKRYNGPDLILLDLRLLNEGGTLQNVHKISGARLLKRIREDFPGQPIMMTTASNKAWTVRELSKLGIDCYWTKEGIDISQSLSQEDRKKYSANNYFSFLKYVNAITGNDYQLLKKLERLIKNISKNGNWWESPNWIGNLGDDTPELNSDQIKTERKIIIENLINVLFLLRHYFHLIHFQQGYKQSNSSWFYPSLIIQHLGKIVEVIHSFEELIKKKDFHPKKETVLKPRHDKLGIEIYELRNRASHFNNARHLKTKDIHTMSGWIQKYLLKTPNCVANKKVN